MIIMKISLQNKQELWILDKTYFFWNLSTENQ